MADKYKSTAPPPPKPPRVGPLRNIRDIGREQARLYRRAAAGTVDAGRAAKLGYLLIGLRETLTVADLEERVNRLEMNKEVENAEAATE